jgi:RHS repeat-associated protein
VAAGLELRGAAFDGTDYADNVWTEAPYLLAHGTRLARVHYAANDLPTLTSGNLHVLLELADHLGSSSLVLDSSSGEMVEASIYEAYGAAESDCRPSRWDSYREDHRFTGKEEDVEVGLLYFGKRYLSPLSERWTSADPLSVHGLQADQNAYAYVRGAAFKATDPTGLQEKPNALDSLKKATAETPPPIQVSSTPDLSQVPAPLPHSTAAVAAAAKGGAALVFDPTLGHHFVPREIIAKLLKEGRIDKAAAAVFESERTGWASGIPPHQWSKAHQAYSETVLDKFTEFAKGKGVIGEEGAKAFVEEVKSSSHPTIRGFLDPHLEVVKQIKAGVPRDVIIKKWLAARRSFTKAGGFKGFGVLGGAATLGIHTLTIVQSVVEYQEIKEHEAQGEVPVYDKNFPTHFHWVKAGCEKGCL